MTSAPATEAADARYPGFDTWRDDAILAALLEGRQRPIVTKITGVDTAAAVRALELSHGELKPAVLIAAGVSTPAEAGDLLGQTRGNLRMALANIGATTPGE
jgi:N-acetylmuramic acid 6-phosphate (MurNAc-6-P) etherase